MSSNLSVRVTADVVDLQTKFAVAKAEVSGLTAEMNKLARASAAGTIDSAGTARLQQLAGDLIQARAATQGYAGALEKAGVSLSTFGRSMESGHGSISTATREFRALFDELSSGRTRQTPGTLAIIAQRVLGLGPAALGAVAGVGALAGGLAYLAVKGIEASNALARMKISADFAGNFDVTTEKLESMQRELELSANISSSAAKSITADLVSIPNIAGPALDAATALMGRFAGAVGGDAEKAGAELKKLLLPDVSASQVVTDLEKMGASLTQIQRDAAAAADRAGNANEVLAEKLQLVNEAASQTRQSQASLDASRTASFTNYLGYLGEELQGLDAGRDMIDQQRQAWEANSAAINKNVEALRAKPPTADQDLQAGLKTARGENPIALQIQEAQDKVQTLQTELARVKDTASQADIKLLNDGLEKAKQNLAELQFGPVLDQMRDKMSQLAATWDGTQSALLRKQLQIAQQTLSSVAQGSKEYLAIKQDEATKEIEIRRAVSSEALAAARAQVAGLTGDSGTTQRLEAEEQIWQKLLAGDQLNAAAREEVQRSYNADVAAIARAREAEQAQIARSNANTDIAISRLNLEATKNSLDAQVAATKEAVAQKYAALKTLADQEFALDLQALNNELAILPQESAAYAETYNQIRELKAKLVAELAALDREQAEDAKRAAKEQASDWKGIVGEIEQSESGMVSDILTKRKSLSQSLEALGAELVTKEIANDVKAFTTKALLQDQTKALEQGGILFHLLAQTQQTAATVQAQTAQTGAVIAGNSARNAATASAAAAGKAASAASGGAQVLADAAKAFSGTYASVSQIPVVGWLLAPPAAAAAYAAVAAYEGLASLDVGTNYVPRDMLAQIHEGEAVVPKAYNPAASGGAGGGGALGGDTHNYGGGNTINVSDTSLKRMLAGRGAQRDVLNALAGAYRRGARPR